MPPVSRVIWCGWVGERAYVLDRDAQPITNNDDGGDPGDRHDAGDLGDMHQELRILLPGAQVLTAFLIVLPFNQGFPEIRHSEKWIYLATFLCSIGSLVFLSSSAAHHRLERPLRDRVGPITATCPASQCHGRPSGVP